MGENSPLLQPYNVLNSAFLRFSAALETYLGFLETSDSNTEKVSPENDEDRFHAAL